MDADYSFAPIDASMREPVIDIFNHFIENGFAAYGETKQSYGDFDDFMKRIEGRPAYAVMHGDSMVGFGALRRYHPADTLKHVGEAVYFILPEHTGKCVGSALLERLSQDAGALGVEIVLVNISSLNSGSLNFHREHGFTECGRFPGVIRKKGKEIDQVWMLKRI